jgi:hypothetical protein
MSHELIELAGLSNLLKNGKLDEAALRGLPHAAEVSSDIFTNWTVTYTDGILRLSCDVQFGLPFALVAADVSAPDGTLYCGGSFQLFSGSPAPNRLQVHASTALFKPEVHGRSVESQMLLITIPPEVFYQKRTFTV